MGSLEAWRQGVEQAERVIGREDGAGWRWSLADWVRVAKARGLAGLGQELVAGWATLGTREATAWAAERTCCRTDAPRMRDDRDEAAGSSLCTGAVERADHPVIGARGTQARRCWQRPGLRLVLALRALLRAHRWAA